jgi:hypothetical protein
MDAAPDPAAPTVSSTTPLAGAAGVLSNVVPTVRFSETMSKASILPGTVMLLDEAGLTVPLAAGYPILSTDLLTARLKPAVSMGAGRTYRIQVIGGAAGVKDAAGTAMLSGWIQSPGFTIAGSDSTKPQVAAATPPGGSTGVATLVQPTVTFSEAIALSTVKPDTVRLLDFNGKVIPQASGYPILSSDGKVATIKPAAALKIDWRYKVQVVGGPYGVKDRAGNAMDRDWAQSTWTTGASTSAMDLEGPIVSGATVESVEATHLVVGWTTDEPATSQVRYRLEGQEAYVETAPTSSLERVHRVAVAGLLPDSAYEVQVRSADERGNAAISSPDQRVATLRNGLEYVSLEAEAGALLGAVVPGTGDGVSGGGWIELPADALPGTASSPAGTALYTVGLSKDGTWYLWVRVKGTGWSASLNGAPPVGLAGRRPAGFSWARVDLGDLGPGEHTIELVGIAPGTRVDQLVVTEDPDFAGPRGPVQAQPRERHRRPRALDR